MNKTLKIFNTIAFIAMITVNILANALPLFGNATGAVSLKYENLFTPAGFTFIIWGVIYFFMTLFVLYQWGFLDTGKLSSRVTKDIGPWFIISCAFNILWIFAWHSERIGLSVISIVFLLFSLLVIESQLELTKRHGITPRTTIGVGFDIYFGWIIAATIANITVWLTAIDWNRFGLSENFWLIFVILAGAAISSLTAVKMKRWVPAGAVMWAYIGILARHISSDFSNGGYTAFIIAGIVIVEFLVFVVLPKAKSGNDYEEIEIIEYTP